MNKQSETAAGKRIAGLLDDSSFVEIGSYVTSRNTDFNMTAGDTPADGVITGYGTIDGALVYVYSQDATVLGGSIGEMHAKKIVNLYNMAMKMGAPVIGLVDCAGLRLQEATDALNAFGEVFAAKANASGVIPQITAIFGVCGGGMAIVPSLTDFTFMEEKKAKLFVNSPNVFAKEDVEGCDIASAKFQAEEAGIVDMIGSEDEIFAKIRDLIGMIPANNEDGSVIFDCNDSLNRLCDGADALAADASAVASLIADDGNFLETKTDFAEEMVTGFIRLNGACVGVVANRSAIYDSEGKTSWSGEAVLSAKGCRKAAEFVNFCDAFEIPVLTLTNVKGFASCKCSEKNISREAARLAYAFANATVPKVNVIIGSAYGSAYVTMNSKALGADVTFAWPTASIGMMDSAEAAKIIYNKEIAEANDPKAVIAEKAAQYQALQSSAESAARRGYVDDIIEAAQTRKRVIAAFEMLFTKREVKPAKKHGTTV